jgi:hypothetical protein
VADVVTNDVGAGADATRELDAAGELLRDAAVPQAVDNIVAPKTSTIIRCRNTCWPASCHLTFVFGVVPIMEIMLSGDARPSTIQPDVEHPDGVLSSDCVRARRSDKTRRVGCQRLEGHALLRR